MSLIVRRRKKSKPIEQALEALNKLGSRRRPKFRFTVHFNNETGKLIVSAKHTEAQLPLVLQHVADEIYIGDGADKVCIKPR